MRHYFFVSLVFLAALGGCKNPEKVYFQEIQRLGVIPFRNPVSAISTGTPLRGKPGEVIPIAPPSRCFPDEVNGEPTQLRWASQIMIPTSYRNLRFDFNGNLNSLIAAGTPGVQFNLNMTVVEKVELEIRDAQIEMMDQLAVKDFYSAHMSQSCKEMLMNYPFIVEALQVNAMAFSFFDSFGGKLTLTSENIGDFALFGADVQWYIEQGSKLVILTPKYIGYKLAQLRPEDNGFVHLTSSQVKNGDYVWVDGQPKSNLALPNG
ncbi:hypothetical protein EBT16_02360 [bacterium]|nr:hypothetical protein [bacterium]